MAIYKKDGVDGDNSFPRKLVTLKISLAAAASITKGQWVAIDTSITDDGVGSGCKITTASGELTFGVANETVTNSASTTQVLPVQIQTAGRFVGASVDKDVSIAAGDGLDGRGDADGRAGKHAESDAFGACGVALTAPATDETATVMIIDKGYY